MEDKDYSKIIWILGFVLLAGVSCWATNESLHLLLPSWPSVFTWGVTITFFIAASFGTKLIVDSLNTDVHVEHRRLGLFGGIFMVIIFWLICSMPTNTHTFFYRTIIGDKVNNDIISTKSYLEQIKYNTNNKNQAALKIKDLDNNVGILLVQLDAEIKNAANPGFGPKSKAILSSLASVLGVAKIEPLSYRGVSVQQRNKLVNAYRKKVYMLRDSRAENIRKNILSPNPSIINQVTTEIKNLDRMKDYIDKQVIDLNNPKDIEDVNNKLNIGYNTIKNNKDFVNFSSKADEERYTADKPITEVKRTISVFDVWGDYLHGEYSGRGFIFWILISILVDVAAFIFFTLAFKKREY